MKSAPTVLVLGGGVSGYAAAISLAKSGHAVTLLEQDLPGPDRLGESLDWETPRLLEKLDISIEDLITTDEAAVKGGAIATHSMMDGELRIGFHLIYRVLMKLVGRSQATYHVDRGALTRTLHTRASQAGVRFIEARVASVDVDGDRVLAVNDDEGNRYTADHFVDSTGRARVLAKAQRIGVTKVGPKKFAISARLTHQYDHLGTRIRLDDSRPSPSWLWDINTAEERTDVGAVLVAKDVATARRSGMQILDIYQSELDRHDDLGWAQDFPLADHDLDRTTFQDQISDRLSGENWVLVGQAAVVIDPILSSGMSFAFRSGLSGANVIDTRIQKPNHGEIVSIRHDRSLRSYGLTVNTLLDELWYKSRLRMVHGFSINVLLLLVCNFNLNHLQSRWFVQTRFGTAALIPFHRMIRWLIPGVARCLEAIPQLRPAPPAPLQLQENSP